MIFIFYGELESSEYEEYCNIEDFDVECWVYFKLVDKGFDGKKLCCQYCFVKEGDVIEFFVNMGVDQWCWQFEQCFELMCMCWFFQFWGIQLSSW